MGQLEEVCCTTWVSNQPFSLDASALTTGLFAYPLNRLKTELTCATHLSLFAGKNPAHGVMTY